MRWHAKRDQCKRLGHRTTLIAVFGLTGLLVLGFATAVARGDESTGWCDPNSPFGNADPTHNLVVNAGQTYQMSGNADWHDVTVLAGGTLDTRGYILRVCGTLTNRGTIIDSRTGGAGGADGTGGRGHDPWEDNDPAYCELQPLCTPGDDGDAGSTPLTSQPDQNGRGGHGGGGGGGGGGAWWNLASYDADGGNGGAGGSGGKGGGHVRIWAFQVDNAQGVIHADGLPGGAADNAAPKGSCPCNNLDCGPEHCQWGAGTILDPYKDISGGGGGGGGAGRGGNGGTVEIHYCLRVAEGTARAYGGAGGTRGDPGGFCCNSYGVLSGNHRDGCEGGSGGGPGAGNGGHGGAGEHREDKCSGAGAAGGNASAGDAGDVNWIYVCGTYDPNDFDVIHYSLALTLDPDNGSTPLDAANTMQIFCEGTTLSTFQFRLDELAFGANTQISIKADPNDSWVDLDDWGWQGDAKTVCVALDRPYNAGEDFFLRVAYAGTPRLVTDLDANPDHIMRAGLFVGTHGPDDAVAFTFAEPWFAYLWLPVKDDGDASNADEATGDFAITVPATGAYADWTVVATGKRDGVDTLGDYKTFRWSTGYHTAAYLFSFAATNYVRSVYGDCDCTHTDGTVTVPLELYVYPEDDLAGIVRAAWHRWVCGTVDKPEQGMIDVFGRCFGAYPFASEKYAIYEWDNNENHNRGLAMEHQTGSAQWTANWLWTQKGFRWHELVTAHELAHQWWGDNVTCATWHDIWLNEGAASYSDALWFEHHPYPAAIPGLGGQHTLQKYLCTVRRPADTSLGRSVYRYDVSDPDLVFDDDVVYNKAAWVLHMLRHLADSGVYDSDSPLFFTGMREYRAQHEVEGTAATPDFQAAFETVFGEAGAWDTWPAPRNLAWFLGDPNAATPYAAGGWVYGLGAPALYYYWEQNATDHVQLYVKQVQCANLGEPTFTMPLDVQTRRLLQWTDHPLAVWLDRNDACGQWISYTIPVDGNIGKLELDHDEWVLLHFKSELAGGGLVNMAMAGSALSDQALRLNDRTQVVGAMTSTGQDHAFMWLAKPHFELAAGVNDLGVLPGHTRSASWNVNRWGQVVGESGTNDVTRAFLWLPEPDYGFEAGLHELPADASTAWARAVNDGGQVAGNTRTDPNDADTNRAVVWQYDWETSMWQLTNLPTASNASSGVHDLNNAGDIVGWHKVNGDPTEAVIWRQNEDDGTWQRTVLGAGAALAINDAGMVVGYATVGEQQNAGYWTYGAGRAYTWETIATSAIAYAVNAWGQIVGEHDGEAFLYLPEPMYGLPAGTCVLNDELVPTVPCWSFTVGADISNSGQIALYGHHTGQAEPRAVLLDLENLSDWQSNGILDACDLETGNSCDEDANGIPDESHPLYCPGDLNCDRQVDFGDINPFVMLLTDDTEWHSRHPDCPIAVGDVNHNCVVGFDDINAFVDLLTQNPLPIPCP